MNAWTAIEAARTFLFVPASRPDRFARAHESGPDVVILDLEDAVAPGDKPEALRAAVRWLETVGVGPVTMVRINGTDSPTHDTEVAALRGTGAPLMVPKSESAAQLGAVRRRAGGAALVPLVETPRGILRSEEIADADGVVRLALGHIDLAAAIGVAPDCHDAFRLARSQLVLAGAAAGLVPPIDGVTTALDDEARLVHDIVHAAELGFGAKLCIHPRQIAAVHDAFRPGEQEIVWARRVAAAADAGASGAIAVDGQMVDPPVVARARTILLRARAN